MASDRLATAERLQAGLLGSLRTIAAEAETGEDPARLEREARALLSRTRDEVVALTAPMDVPPSESSDARRERRRPRAWEWVVLAAVVSGWCAIIAVSRLVAPLDGTLGGTLFAIASACAVGLLRDRWLAATGLVMCLAGQLVGVGTDDQVGEGGMILAGWLGGLAVSRARRLVEERRISDRMRVEHDAAQSRRAIVAERLRLAREIHDQLGHSLTVIVLQAGAARRIAASEPDRTAAAMSAIAAAARAGVAAMESPPRTDVDGMLRRTRDAGLHVTADVAVLDTDDALDPMTREIACRIVQESLTNALRHAPGAPANVTVRRSGSAFTVDVSNGVPARSGGPPGTGRGLDGLRDRVLVQGGELEWGPEGDGFRVHAVLPAGRAGAHR